MASAHAHGRIARDPLISPEQAAKRRYSQFIAEIMRSYLGQQPRRYRVRIAHTDTKIHPIPHDYCVVQDGVEEIVVAGAWQFLLPAEQRSQDFPQVLAGQRTRISTFIKNLGITDQGILDIWLP